jgi:hypothetical protein
MAEAPGDQRVKAMQRTFPRVLEMMGDLDVLGTPLQMALRVALQGVARFNHGSWDPAEMNANAEEMALGLNELREMVDRTRRAAAV